MDGQLRKSPSAPMYEHCGSGFIALSTPRVAYATTMNCSTRNTSMALFVHILRNQALSRSTPKLSHTRSEGCGARATTRRCATPSRATKARTSDNSSLLATPCFASRPSVSMDRATASSHAARPSSVANVTNAATTRHGVCFFFVFESVFSSVSFPSPFSPKRIGRCFAISCRRARLFSTSSAFVRSSFSRSRISAETSRANTTS